MALKITSPEGDAVANVDAKSGSPLHTNNKPVPYSTVGHYRVAWQGIVSYQFPGRIFTLRNPSSTRLVVPTRLRINPRGGANASTGVDSITEVYTATGFTASDPTTNGDGASTVLTPSKTRASMATAAAEIRTQTGVNELMDGTLTMASTPFTALPHWVYVSGSPQPGFDLLDAFDEANNDNPFVLGQSEGLVIYRQNSGSSGLTVYIDLSWAEVTVY